MKATNIKISFIDTRDIILSISFYYTIIFTILKPVRVVSFELTVDAQRADSTIRPAKGSRKKSDFFKWPGH